MLKKSLPIAIALTCTITLVASSLEAALIVGVDTATPGGGGIYTGVGILDTSSRTWHDADAGNFTLGSNSVSIDLDGATAENIRGGGAVTLFEEIRFNPTNGGNIDWTLTLSGLSDDATYNVVVYGADRSGNRGTAYTVGGMTKSTTGDTSASFIEDTNYVRFDGVSVAGGIMTIDLGNSGEDIRQINGFEIELIPSAATPEPSTIVLAAIGLVGLVVGRRRRR